MSTGRRNDDRCEHCLPGTKGMPGFEQMWKRGFAIEKTRSSEPRRAELTRNAGQLHLPAALALLTSSLAFAGCTAAVAGSANRYPGSSAGSSGTAAGGSSSSGGAGGAAGAQLTTADRISLPAGDVPSAHLHKLTATEFANSVHD